MTNFYHRMIVIGQLARLFQIGGERLLTMDPMDLEALCLFHEEVSRAGNADGRPGR